MSAPTANSVAVPHPSSIIHKAVPLILSSTRKNWPRSFEEVWIAKSQRAFFSGRSVCQIIDNTDPTPAGAWLLGLCTENTTGTAHRADGVLYDGAHERMPDLQTMGVTIRFFSILLDGAMQSNTELKLVHGKTGDITTSSC